MIHQHINAVLVRLWVQLLIFLMLAVPSVQAQTYNRPVSGDSLIGEVHIIESQPGDNFSRIARRYDVGYFQLIEANPKLQADEPLPFATKIIIPSQYLIPNAPRRGIIINLAELRLYYFSEEGRQVVTFPVGIGRQGWNTPVGPTKIISKVANPTWTVPPDIKAARAAEGVILPKSIPPGIDNPLGGFAMRLNFPSYLIHGTNDASGVGRRSSSGCIRMLPEDIENLFDQTKIGAPVLIVNQPYKVGWQGNNLYLEAHLPLQEQQKEYSNLTMIVKLINQALQNRPTANVDWDVVKQVVTEQNGIPTVIAVARGGVDVR